MFARSLVANVFDLSPFSTNERTNNIEIALREQYLLFAFCAALSFGVGVILAVFCVRQRASATTTETTRGAATATASLTTAADAVKYLSMQPHPEGGWYTRTYESTFFIPRDYLPNGFSGSRSLSTAIYFCLTKGNFSAFHRILSDEIWHFYAGDASLAIHEIMEGGEYKCHKLGANFENGERPQLVVKAKSWFSSEISDDCANGSWALVGCTVAPGFNFEDFELAQFTSLREEYPEHASLIRRLTRD